MKPLCLTVQAFGPYAGEQVFDFRQLQDRCLFLITGPTGAGKTTVLDAVCYALYGDTSGQERDAAQMRSQHSDPSTPTEVTFDFALGGQSYRVWRRPQQDRPKKRGEGTITEAAQAMLWKRTGVENDGDKGEPLATRSGEVTEKVEQLLGFRSAQFRQVVLLPQDRFRELLLADSRQRQEILETLFHTEIYRQIEQALKDASKALQEQLEDLKVRRDKVLELAEVENETQLRDRLKAGQAEIVKITAELDERRKAKVEADKALQTGREAQAKLTELDDANKVLRKLTDRQAEIESKRKQRDLGKRASELRDAESQRDQRAGEHKKAQKALDDALRGQKEAQGQLDDANVQLARQKQRQSEMDELRKDQNRLEGLVARVKRLAEAQEELVQRQKAAEAAAKELAQAKKALAETGKELKQTQKDLAVAERLAALVDARRAALKQADTDAGNRAKLQEADAAVKRLTADYKKADKAARDAQRELDAAVKNLRKMEKALQDGYAGHLAKSLKKGETCPVCGSKDHPAPAKVAGEIPDPQELDDLRLQIKGLEKARKAADKNESALGKELAVVQKTVDSLREQLGDKVQASADKLQEILETRRGELIAAEQAQMDVRKLLTTISELEKSQVDVTQQVEQLQAKVRERDGQVQALSSTVKERQAEVPEDLREPEAIKSAIVENKRKVKQLADALESAQATAKAAGEALAAAKAAAEAARKTADEARQTAETEADGFTKRLTKAGFETETQYKAATLAEEQIAMLEQQIEAYNRDVAAAKNRVDRAEVAAKNIQRPDLAGLEAAVGQAQAAVEGDLKRQTDLTGRQNQISQWLKSLADDSQKMISLDKEYQTVGYVADVANGGNDQHITFQRFVLGALLDDVLVAASQRLKIMSKGRYLLQRQQDTLDRRRAGGLDLEVHDAYTGMSRPAGTLSGGESFLAALSLALGLADVVQSYTGGMYLDTIFIDEGFGSLDGEALDAAMQALIDLQKGGRLVGIISHVPELKERIDTRLEVTAAKSGSTAGFVLA
jgi:exonuclease SbcC